MERLLARGELARRRHPHSSQGRLRGGRRRRGGRRGRGGRRRGGGGRRRAGEEGGDGGGEAATDADAAVPVLLARLPRPRARSGSVEHGESTPSRHPYPARAAHLPSTTPVSVRTSALRKAHRNRRRRPRSSTARARSSVRTTPNRRRRRRRMATMGRQRRRRRRTAMPMSSTRSVRSRPHHERRPAHRAFNPWRARSRRRRSRRLHRLRRHSNSIPALRRRISNSIHARRPRRQYSILALNRRRRHRHRPIAPHAVHHSPQPFPQPLPDHHSSIETASMGGESSSSNSMPPSCARARCISSE